MNGYAGCMAACCVALLLNMFSFSAEAAETSDAARLSGNTLKVQKNGAALPFERFFPGIDKKDALKRGAFEAEDGSGIYARAKWGKLNWDLVLFLEKDCVDSVVMLSRTDAPDPSIALSRLAEIGFVPLIVSRAGSLLMLHRTGFEGDVHRENMKLLRSEIRTFSERKDGWISMVFCTRPMFEALSRAASPEEEKDVWIHFAETPSCTVNADKGKSELAMVVAPARTILGR